MDLRSLYPNEIQMSTSMTEQRGLRSQMRRIVLPVAAFSAMVLAASCGGTSGGDSANNSNAPVVSGILPPAGPPAGGTFATINGSGFAADVVGPTTVTFAGVQATNVTVVDDNTITLTTPSHAGDATVDVKVTNSRGTGTLSAGFHYLATASILSDLNSDGIPDIAIGATQNAGAGVINGSVFVFYGLEQSLAIADRLAGDADLRIESPVGSDKFGSILQTGDVNSDGHTDLLVGAPKADTVAVDAGAVYIFLGPLPASGVLTTADANIVLAGEGTVGGQWWGVRGDEFGSSISLADANADGSLDILVGAPGADMNVGLLSEIENGGRAYLFHGGGTLDSRNASAAETILSGVRENDQLGSEVLMADLNADGQTDLIVAFDVFVSGPTHSGRVAVFTQGGMAAATSNQANVVLSSSHNGERFGASMIRGDVNADGIADLVVGAPFNSSMVTAGGRVYVFLGGAGLANAVSNNADVIFSGQLPKTDFGSKIISADVNGDGFDDVLVAAPHTTHQFMWDGQVFVFFGETAPVDTVAYSSNVVLTGELVEGASFGSAIEVLDSDMDGIADMMSSAPGLSASTGRVYVFMGEETLVDQSAVNDDLTLSGSSAGGGFGSAISRGK